MSSNDQTKPAEAQTDTPQTGEHPEASEMDDSRMSFIEHLAELRTRLRTAAIVFLVAVIGSFVVVKEYFTFLIRPATRAWATRCTRCMTRARRGSSASPRRRG